MSGLYESATETLYVCATCGAAVFDGWQLIHSDWHLDQEVQP